MESDVELVVVLSSEEEEAEEGGLQSSVGVVDVAVGQAVVAVSQVEGWVAEAVDVVSSVPASEKSASGPPGNL